MAEETEEATQTTTGYSKDTIVTDVRTCYDEIASNDADFTEGDQDEQELDTIIKSKIAEAIRYVYGNCDESLLDADDVIVYSGAGSVVNKVVTVDLDGNCDNWLRIIWAKLTSWPYAIRDILHEGDEDAKFLEDTYCGPTYEKPALLLTRSYGGTSSMTNASASEESEKTTTSGRILKFYKGKDEKDKTAVIAYIGDVTASESENYNISGKLYPAVIYYICGLVATTFGERARAQDFFEIAVSMMGVAIKENNSNS